MFKLSAVAKRVTLLLALFGYSAVLTSCGAIGLGGGNALNDARPTGIVVKQAQFFAASGQTGITGTALIFLNTASSYILRLEGLNVPEESSMQVKIFLSPSGLVTLSLRGTSGNQNYNFTSPASGFLSVSIFSTITQTNYATATFTN